MSKYKARIFFKSFSEKNISVLYKILPILVVLSVIIFGKQQQHYMGKIHSFEMISVIHGLHNYRSHLTELVKTKSKKKFNINLVFFFSPRVGSHYSNCSMSL